MFEFLNPGFLAAGAALVSLPILIHLINRLRFKRVRWAAMEFLLKSQKRNRRRLIIEQLLLLALRCLLVLLSVLLVSRYLFAFFQPQNTLHVVLLDDTLSMSDQWKKEGETYNCFQVGKSLITAEIAKYAAQARTAQRLVLIQATDPDTVRFDQRLDDQSIGSLQRILAETECTPLHAGLQRGLEAAQAIFGRNALDRRILHVVSDFRQRDWAEPDAAGLTRVLESMAQTGVKINLIDTAEPQRAELQNTVQFHDNLAVVDLHAQARVVAKDVPVEFVVAVQNFSASERANVRVTVKVNGEQRAEGSLTMQSVPPGQTTQTFTVSFPQLGFNQITANLENEDAGLTADNTNYAVVEVRKQVPVLLVDGSGPAGLSSGGDTYHLQALFSAARSYQVVPRGTQELEQPNLDQYPSIYLLNVRSFSPKAIQNLENYVRDGGSVAFFLGDRVDPVHYNDKLYAGGKGLFPAPLADRTFPPLSDPELQPDLFDGQPKIFLRSESHPITAKVYKYRDRFFKYLPIRRYFPVLKSKWAPEPGRVEELITLPNQRAVGEYAGEAQEILDQLSALSRQEGYAKYAPGLQLHSRAIRDTLTGKQLYELSNALEAFLQDRGDASDPKRPNLVEMWEQPDLKSLRSRIARFRERVQLGDPLLIAAAYGKGRVVAFLSTAGRAWNDWGGGSLASSTYPMVMGELQRWLIGTGSEAELTVGTPLEIQLDNARYEPRMHRFFQPEPKDNEAAAPPVDLKEQTGTTSGGRLTFLFEEARRPGMYRFELARRVEEGNAASPTKPETRAFAFNVDPREGDLRRAARDDLERTAPGAKLRTPGSGWAAELADRRSDLSESGWLFLLFLLVLLAEQALAVYLSFHLRGDVATPTPQPVAA
jgi:hypothetical protein